ncbi:MAG: PqiC family protein [Salinisphaera sp.]|jgi:uncharacterized lipoprotein YmbA|nr:PqiC family protein [Salinisphaera sp.]
MKQAPTRRAGALALATVMLAGLAACSSAPPLKHVMLSPPQTERLPARPSNWEVRRVKMPEYLDNYDIQLRTADYVLTRMPDAKWAERLPVAVTRLLQQTIDEKLVNHRDRHYRVDVDIDTFEPQPSGHVVLSASWKVLNAKDKLVTRDDTLIQEPLPKRHQSPSAVGQAMSTAVRELALQIVSAAG